VRPGQRRKGGWRAVAGRAAVRPGQKRKGGRRAAAGSGADVTKPKRRKVLGPGSVGVEI
jgi:hypothetical protein